MTQVTLTVEATREFGVSLVPPLVKGGVRRSGCGSLHPRASQSLLAVSRPQVHRLQYIHSTRKSLFEVFLLGMMYG